VEKLLGKIKCAEFGLGGYQGLQFGLWLDLESESKKWNVSTSISGSWSMMMEITKDTEWTDVTRDCDHLIMCKKVTELLSSARINHISQLINKPIEANFDGGKLMNWRILDEVL
jgi:hypothetical protein